MPKASELCEVKVRGKVYGSWTGVQVQRSYQVAVSAIELTIAERVDAKWNAWRDLPILVGDACEVKLAGRTALTGVISQRDPAFDANVHQLKVIGLSKVADMVHSSPQTDRSEYKGYGLPALARAMLGPMGISLKIDGSPPNLDKPFPRFSIHPGESVLEALDRATRLRNCFIRDDHEGNLVIGQGGQKASGAELEEGRNILSASGTFCDEYALNKIDIVAQAPSTDQRYGTAASVKATATNDAVRAGRQITLIMEHPGDKEDAKMRADREMAENLATMVKVRVTVQGWLKDQGSAWLECVGQTVNVKSRMLFPTGSMPLAIETVTCRQGPFGTLTDLDLCLPGRLGGSARIGINGLTGA